MKLSIALLIPVVALATAGCDFPYPGDYVPDAGPTSCGNDRLDEGEVCDGLLLAGNTCESRGHAAGMLTCAPSCLTFDESACTDCGNGMRQGVEACDGADHGDGTCTTLGFAGGTLACS